MNAQNEYYRSLSGKKSAQGLYQKQGAKYFKGGKAFYNPEEITPQKQYTGARDTGKNRIAR
jgi:hypothetical protein